MESNNNTPHHNSDLKLLALVFISVGIIFLTLTILSFKVLKNVSGENWQQEIVNKIESWVKEIEGSKESPTLYPSQNPTTTTNTTNSTSNSNTNIQVTTPTASPQPINENCYRYPITIKEFESNNCYNLEDYSVLTAYLYEYQRAKSVRGGAEASIEITCDGSELFEDNCERSKAQKEQSEADMEKYKVLINEIIKKGK